MNNPRLLIRELVAALSALLFQLSRALTAFAVVVLVVMILSAFTASPAYAQDAPPVVVVSQPADIVSPDSQITLQFIVEIAVKALGTIAFAYVGGAQLVQILTGFIKQVPAITSRVSPQTIAFCLSLTLSFGAALASHFGFFPQYDNAIAGATTILAGLFGTRLLAAQSHDSYVKDKARGLAVLGGSSAATQTVRTAYKLDPGKGIK